MNKKTKYTKPRPTTTGPTFDDTDTYNAVKGQTYLRAYGKTKFWERDALADAFESDERFRAAVYRKLDSYNATAKPERRLTRPKILDYIESRQDGR